MNSDIKEIKEREIIHSEPEKKKSNSKIYFFIIAISALLATNIYFYVKYKSSGEKLYTITLQKESLQIEIDRIEAELDNIQLGGINTTTSLVAAEQSARAQIDGLRTDLDNNEIDDQQIESAKLEVAQLKDQVFLIKDEVSTLRIRNQLLAENNVELSQQARENQAKLEALTSEREALNDKIVQASSIKASNIHISGVQVKKDGVLEHETRAKRIDQLQINFTIADNPIAEVGEKDIFVRIINPKGNLIANSEDLFYVHGEKLQYTFKEDIQFTNNGREYQMNWADDQHRFQKGAYTVLLYADNAIMGRSSVVLK
ncbi:MAG TPA: hypothetical protein H9825_12795 [Candidatus Sphingobacterium stercorigallinarum]|nr:hypothetical protein [Candidatus Sphingobacterium stercorigallinarum]